jgi:hypothetical protein
MKKPAAPMRQQRARVDMKKAPNGAFANYLGYGDLIRMLLIAIVEYIVPYPPGVCQGIVPKTQMDAENRRLLWREKLRGDFEFSAALTQ